MARPDLSDLHVSQLLTGVSVAYFIDPGNFVADRVFPQVLVDAKFGMYLVYDKGAWFRSEAKEVVDGEETPGVGWTTTTGTYNARVWGVHADIGEQEMATADPIFDLENNKTRLAVNDLRLNKDKAWAASFFKTGIWVGGTGGTDQTGVSGTPSTNQFKQWDQTGSTPIKDVQTQRIATAEKTGVMPNVLVLGPYVELALQSNADILDRIKYTQRGFISRDLLATAFGVDEVLVPTVNQNTANDGATVALSFLYGKSALLAYRPPNPAKETPSSGYQFVWRGFLGSNAAGGRISKYPIPQKGIVNRVEAKSAYDMQAIAKDTAVFFATAVG
jgi:hypothetical protein